ncbi:MAG: sensor histidine kinase KdpD [Clostridia bacterium]
MPHTHETPDELLKRIEEEARQPNGRLKIFFGYAAGVGKTYAMLEDAQLAKEHGIDVIAGYIEPHTRPQTMELLNGLEVLSPFKIQHKGITLKDFNLDAALLRKPQLILVDELAHTNAHGCRHVKRYQDVAELLAAGINVYTTVNVQHIESLCDIVASITGVTVRERIPDHVFDNASQVELVDIEPTDLINRLTEGKVYRQDQAQKALNNFFTVDNLTALREISLRRAADRVNRLSERAKLSPGIGHHADEHILVCLSSSPTNPKSIRTAARLANAFNGGFTAIFVETSSYDNMSEENKLRLINNTRLAEQLGAKIETVFGDDIAFQIAEFARYSGVSKIVIGRSNTKRRFGLMQQSFSEKLTSFAPNLDIYIIPDKSTPPYKAKYSAETKNAFNPIDLIKSALILLISTLIGFIFYLSGFNESNIITIYILGVLLTAAATGNRIYSLLSSLLSVLIFNFLFTEPRFTLSFYDFGYPVTFAVMFFAAFITGGLAGRIKKQAKQSAGVAYRTSVLLETNRLLQQEKNADGIAEVTAKQLIKLLDKTVVYYGANDQALAVPIVFPAEGGDKSEAYLTPNEQAVAAWVYKNNKHAGATTNTLSSAKCLYLAVRSAKNIYGVFGIDLLSQQSIGTFETNLMLSILGECALALEQDAFDREREKAAIQAKNEQLRANLLRSISHDLRTPLTGISGNASMLLTNGNAISEEKKKKLYLDIFDDSAWLIGLVENLLSVTRIEDGTMHLNLQSELVSEVIAEALRYINRKSAEHTIRVIQNDELILAKMDVRLILQVFINIIDNAIKYTPRGSEIVICAKKENGLVKIKIADDGPGIANEFKPHLFDMFYTTNNKLSDSRRGMGLGLALCKSIVNAHGGVITEGDNKPHGAVFTFTLRAEEITMHE